MRFVDDQLDRLIHRPVPLVRREQEDLVQRLVAIAAEHVAVVDAVLLDQRRAIAIRAVHVADVDGELAGKLAAIAERELVDERLVIVGIDDAVRRHRRRRGRHERRLEHAVEIVVVEVAEADRLRAGALRAGAARRLRVDARRVVAAHVGGADRVALIGGHHVVHAEARPDLPAVLQLDVEQIVLPRHVIDAHARR